MGAGMQPNVLLCLSINYTLTSFFNAPLTRFVKCQVYYVEIAVFFYFLNFKKLLNDVHNIFKNMPLFVLKQKIFSFCFLVKFA